MVQINKERLLLWISRLILMMPFLVIGGPILLWVWVATSHTLENNKILHKYETAFQGLLHPRSTSKIDAFGEVRRSPGNGDNCFYFVGQLREYLGSPIPIQNFYSTDVMAETFSQGEFHVEFAVNDKFSDRVPYGLNDLAQWPINQPTHHRNIYIVYWLIPDYLTPYSTYPLDLRCH